MSRAALNVSYADHGSASQPPEFDLMESGFAPPHLTMIEGVLIVEPLKGATPPGEVLRSRGPPLS